MKNLERSQVNSTSSNIRIQFTVVKSMVNEREKAAVLSSMTLAESTKDNGTPIKEMVEAMNYLVTAMYTKESTPTEKLMAKELIPGRTAKSMTVNGVKDTRAVMVSGEAFMATAISVNGKTAKPRATEFTPG